MKKLFLLSACLIGLGFTACQKEEMPDPPATQTEEAVAATPVYTFSKAEAILNMSGGFDKGRSDNVHILVNGAMKLYSAPNGTVWLEQMPGYPDINTYVQVSYSTTYYPTLTVSFKNNFNYDNFWTPVRGYLKFRVTNTGEVLTANILAHPHWEPGDPLL